MRIIVSTFAVTLLLAAAPTLALSGPMNGTGSSAAAAPTSRSPSQSGPARTFHGPTLLSDEAMSRITAGGEFSISVPTTNLPVCIGELVCPPNSSEFSNVSVTFNYPPSPCTGEVDFCTDYITLSSSNLP